MSNLVPKPRVLFSTFETYDYSQWDTFMHELQDFIADEGPFLIKGTVGRWNGTFKAGRIIEDIQQLANAWKDCDYIKFTDYNGALFLKCAHHDGINNFEIRKITPVGQKYCVAQYPVHLAASCKTLHDQLWASRKYTQYPHFAYKVYGMPKRQMEVAKS